MSGESSEPFKGSQKLRKDSESSQNTASKPMPEIPSPISEESNPVDQIIATEEIQLPPASKQPHHRASFAGISWNMNSFESSTESSHSSSFSQSEWEKGLREPVGDRGARYSTAIPGEAAARSAVTGLRRASVFVAKAAKDVGSMDRQIGNPWDLRPGQTKRIPSVAYDRPARFEGRQKSVVSSQGRRPSTILRDGDLIKLKADDDPTDFVILLVAEHDDLEHISKLKRRLYMTTPIWGTLTMVFYWIYFAMRIRFTISAQNASGKVFAEAWAFIGVELGVAIPMMLHRVWYTFILGGRHPPKLRLIGNSVPSVDVLITCCGEDADLVYNTARAACNIDYPTDRFRVIILDDGADAELQKLIDGSVHDGFDNMYYMSRPKYPGVPHHFKAGNLNYGLEATKGMSGGAANFIAALDADMIPERDWLRALLPHILQDGKCSMSCPPQLFYNVPENDLLCQSLDTFVHISEPIKDSLGVAWCTGSGYVMRRTSLDDIGWFPTGSLAEDVCTSSMMLGAGWNTAYVHEPLQFGTVPDSLSSHLKQRTRWTIGTIQTSLKLRFCLYGPYVKSMTISQRFSGFVYTISAMFTLFLVASVLTIPIVLISGGNLVPYSTVSQLRWLMRGCFALMVVNRITEFVFFLPAGYRVGQREALAMMWMAPYHAIAVVQSFILPKWLGGKIAVFSSSGSQSSELNERDSKMRAPLLRRLRVTLINCKAYIHLAYILFVLASIILSTCHCFESTKYKVSGNAKLQCLITHAGWPPVLWLVLISSFFVPIHYAFWPPSVPEREDLWERDPKTGVGYPSEEAKSVKASRWHWFREGQYTLLCLYTTLIFAYSFLIKGPAYY